MQLAGCRLHSLIDKPQKGKLIRPEAPLPAQDAAAGHHVKPVAVACDGACDADVRLFSLQVVCHKCRTRVQPLAVFVECFLSNFALLSKLYGV